METRKGGLPVRTVLLALLVVGAAIASIGMIQHKKRTDEDAQVKQDAQPIEVTPLVIKGDITEASWRQPGEPEASEQQGREETDWHVDSAQEERFDASLETTMKPINGLGVFVSKSADDEDDPKEQDK